jgi:K+-transporting ATPase ATPase B chain
MDRALRANVITKSGKAVETAGDIDVLLLDKTGTITIGNRKATHFYPANGIDEKHFIDELCIKFDEQMKRQKENQLLNLAKN